MLTHHPVNWFRERLLTRAWLRIVIVVTGIVVGQFILYWPSLIGQKVLLPLDHLALRGVYVPQDLLTPGICLHNAVLSDLVLNQEPARRFMAEEIHAGRWPLWSTYQYSGAPFTWPKYSPFWLLNSMVLSPVVLAWTQVLIAVVAGLGFYLFCRISLCTGFWPAALVAWCFPLTGFFVFWQGYSLPMAVAWMPWLMVAVDCVLAGQVFWSGPALVFATYLTLVSGQLDVAGQVLIASGIYALWRYVTTYRRRLLHFANASRLLAVVLGWGLGILLACVQYLPLLEYTATGSRISERSQGLEERPPIGIDALPQTVMPDMYGSTQTGSFPMFPDKQGNQLESSAAAYSGLLATLFLAPLAWRSRRHRSFNMFAVSLIVLSLAWSLDIPGFVQVLRMPGLRMMSHNRFVFAASFAVLAMAAIGLESLISGDIRRRWWFWGPAVLLLGIFIWCCFRAIEPPEPLATKLSDAIIHGANLPGISDMAQLNQVRAGFSRNYLVAAVLAAIALGGWLVVTLRANLSRWFVVLCGSVMIADLLWFGYGRSAQCPWQFYYPRIPVLEEIRSLPPGRIIGVNCFPATLSQSHNLCDVRGYDGVDPAQWMDLMKIAAVPETLVIPYARTLQMAPTIWTQQGNDLRIHPVLDMLGVRYLIFRGAPPVGWKSEFALTGKDYWVFVNRHALPKVFIPRHIEVDSDAEHRRQQLASVEFRPSEVAFVEEPINLPANCDGQASIVSETPTNLKVEADMKTAGLLVLTDRWDKGWRAYLDGRQVPILRTNHAVRGVEVPAGKSTIEFRYEPASLAWGMRLSIVAMLSSIGWLGLSFRNRGQVTPSLPELPPSAPEPDVIGKKKSDDRRPGKRRRGRS